jgi:hypothetical protein
VKNGRFKKNLSCAQDRKVSHKGRNFSPSGHTAAESVALAATSADGFLSSRQYHRRPPSTPPPYPPTEHLLCVFLQGGGADRCDFMIFICSAQMEGKKMPSLQSTANGVPVPVDTKVDLCCRFLHSSRADEFVKN